jgi:uncharacterized protein (TIGR03437 family)
MNPDGNGNLGTVKIGGYNFGLNGTSVLAQSSAAVKYSFQSGAAIVTFPTSNSAPYFSGQEYLYFSPDGNFVFGGSPVGFDMLVGVKNGSSGATTQYGNSLYYAAGIDEDESQIATYGYADLDSYYGSLSATGGNIIEVDRVNDLNNANAYSATFSDVYPSSISGNYTNSAGAQYWFGNGGAIRIGAGTLPYLGVSVALQAPALTGSGVYLNPMGVANSASSAPFTAGISDGELITLYGSGLASRTVVASQVPFPTTLGGVQVSINGTLAPIYYVSSTQISVIVPYELANATVAAIQVTNNGVASNTVTVFGDYTSAGIFTQNATGLGYAAAVHNSTGALVTPSNPAQPGEYIQVFLTGLGDVNPSVADGSAGPTSPLSYSVYYSTSASANEVYASIDAVSAPIVFAGLAPTLAGLYQVNLQIPTGLSAGDHTLAISGPDSYTAQALISIGSGTASTSSAVTPSEVAAPRLFTGRRALQTRQAPKRMAKAPRFGSVRQ